MTPSPNMRLLMRAQRVPEKWPIVHLESELPEWSHLAVDGHCRALYAASTLGDLAVPSGPRNAYLRFPTACGVGHVQRERWTGVGVDRLLALVAGARRGSHTPSHAASDEYSGVFPVD